MEGQSTTPKRPTFLTVLCILSFIGVAIQIIQGVMTMGAGAVGNMAAEATQASVSTMTSGLDSLGAATQSPEMTQAMSQFNDAMAEANKLIKYASTLGIINIICALICLVGVIMMFKLKKIGFFIYTVAEIAPPIATLVLIGFGLGGFMAILGMIVPIVFIILYGLNLKHMS